MEVGISSTKAGFDSVRLRNIDHWMQRYIDEEKFAGSSVLVARDGRITHLATAGKRSLENDLPFTTGTIVRIYSMTKPIASVALMMLVEKGLLHLEATIDRFLPEFAGCQAVVPGAVSVDQSEAVPAPTVHQLLTHTAGFTYSFNQGLLGSFYHQHATDFNPDTGTLEQRTKHLATMPLAFRPGSRWEYSVSIDVIGRLIEVISGQPLDVFLDTEIFQPLGMVDTGFSVKDQQLSRFADCYVRSDENGLQLADPAQDSAFHCSKVQCFSAGGGLVSTLADYLRFAEMFRCGGALEGVRLLSPRTVRFMQCNHLSGDVASMGQDCFSEMSMHGVGFGLGGAVVLDPALAKTPGSVGDFSWGGMASTFFWIDPVERLTVIFFTQLIPSSSYPSRSELKALVHAALVG